MKAISAHLNMIASRLQTASVESLQKELGDLQDKEQELMRVIRPTGDRYLHSMGWVPFDMAPREWESYRHVSKRVEEVVQKIKEFSKQSKDA